MYRRKILRLCGLIGLLALLGSGAFAQTSNLWRPQPNPTPPPCPRIRQFYNLAGAFQQIDCNGVITTISAGASLQDPGSNGMLARISLNTTAARTLLGTANRIVVTNGNGTADPTFDIGSTVATSASNLSFFAPTTSGQLAGVISDESGSGALVFNSSPTIVTPSIASFLNATHNHEATAGGGQLNASNVFSAGTVALARGGTGSSLVDPNAHRLLGWDDTNGDVRFFTIGSGLNYDAGTDTLSVSGSGGLGDPGANGIVARTALNTTAPRTLQQPAAGLAITNPGGVAGDPTFALANDLAAVEGISSTGVIVRSATDTWTARTIQGTTGQVTVVEGGGVSGNPTVSLPTTVSLGTPGGAPAAGALTGPDASGTNIAGANLHLSGGKGTGNAVPGLVAVRYPLIGASGTTLQSLSANFYPLITSLYTSTNFVTISNTTTETSIFTGLTGSTGSTNTIEAGISRAGTNYRIAIFGNLNTTGTPTLQTKVKMGTTIILDTTAVTMTTSTGRFWMTVDIQVTAIGAGGNVLPILRLDYINAGNGTGAVNTNVSANNIAVDFTVAQAIDVTFQWGTASANNSVTVLGVSIDRAR